VGLTMEYIKTLEAILKPYTCTDKIRVGSTFDGGYILPKKAIGYCSVLLSFGISTNIEFEHEWRS
jgi:hypothetical protein